MSALRKPSMPAPDAAREREAGLERPRHKLAIGCVLAAMALVVHAAAVTNVALPALAASFDVTPAASVRVVTAYQIALLMALLPCAALGESLGQRRVFTTGVALFTCASALCALAPTLEWLLAARFVQGLGAAAVMALGVALLRFAVVRPQLASAIAWNALTVALTSAIAPLTGAVILHATSLPWLFAVHVPLGVVVLLATRGLPEVAGTAAKLDALSVTLNAGVFASLFFALELMLAQPVLAAVVLAGCALLLFSVIHRELPKLSPLVPLDLLGARSFRVSVMASVCCFTGQAAALVALPFQLQHALGQDALATGLMITPWPLSVAIVAPIAGRLADRVSGAWLCAVGGACLALGLGAIALCPLQAGKLALLPCIALCGAGFGLFQVANNRNMLLAAPRERSGAAGALQATARLVGQTLGAVAMGLLFVRDATAAPRVGLGLASVLTLSAGLLSTLRATPAARTTATSSAEARGGCS